MLGRLNSPTYLALNDGWIRCYLRMTRKISCAATRKKISCNVFSVICLFGLDWNDRRNDHLQQKKPECLFLVCFWHLPNDRINPAATSLYGSMWDWTVTFVIEHNSEHPTNAHPCSFFASKTSQFFFCWTWQQKPRGDLGELLDFHLIWEFLICQTH